jgi:hypothetical protein
MVLKAYELQNAYSRERFESVRYNAFHMREPKYEE